MLLEVPVDHHSVTNDRRDIRPLNITGLAFLNGKLWLFHVLTTLVGCVNVMRLDGWRASRLRASRLPTCVCAHQHDSDSKNDGHCLPLFVGRAYPERLKSDLGKMVFGALHVVVNMPSLPSAFVFQNRDVHKAALERRVWSRT
jgi:hypothetical protein